MTTIIARRAGAGAGALSKMFETFTILLTDGVHFSWSEQLETETREKKKEKKRRTRFVLFVCGERFRSPARPCIERGKLLFESEMEIRRKKSYRLAS